MAAVAKEVYGPDLRLLRDKVVAVAHDEDLQKLTKEQAMKLGKLAWALTPGDLKQVGEEGLAGLVAMKEDVATCPKDQTCSFAKDFPGSTKSFCLAQVEAMMRRAKELHGEVDTWDVDKFKQHVKILTGLSESDIAKIPQQGLAVVKEIKCFKPDVLACLAKRATTLIQEAKQLSGLSSEELWKELGQLASGVGADILESAPVSKVLAEFGQVEWTPQQLAVLVANIKAEYGDDVAAWSLEVKSKLGSIAAGLDLGEVRKLGAAVFANPNAAAAIDATLCQAKSLHFLTGEQLDALTKALGYSSDCAQESQFFTAEQASAATGKFAEFVAAKAAALAKKASTQSPNTTNKGSVAGTATATINPSNETAQGGANSTTDIAGATTVTTDIAGVTTVTAGRSSAQHVLASSICASLAVAVMSIVV